MHRKLTLVVAFVFVFIQFAGAQLQSPEQFLGYKIGTRYTPHWRIVEYYKHVAASVPNMVKVEQYGKTNEGRPLIVAYVATPGNLSNLEAIRTNNLALAQLGGTAGNKTGAPAIVWLSYNVHGNETSSSEVALLTLYAVASGTDARTKQWLQNTVIIIDPCLNPDGRDRYVNWFNSVAGKDYNPSLDAREHREPWPGGRTNHYNFDLNRDWAWQTQIESQQRLQLYNKWLPQVHVDYHEQGVNNPYYFAPAAQPYHEVITGWQRDFQNTIGRNHAKYFDQNGWLYFTREVFDLLYPSYGDTYPIYNGSIGMTYEQGGGPSGGASVLTDDGDTLTLLDRVQHHYTTSLSTLEIASQNAPKLVSEFEKFYTTVQKNGVGDFKSFVIKTTPNDAQRVDALLTLLTKNGIQFGTGRGGNYRGLNYNSGKDENFSISGNDIVIPGAQSKGVLAKVLFEPNTVVVDSNTYDITAWALPYVYGVQAFATRQPIALSGTVTQTFTPNSAANPTSQYGYVIPWTGLQSVKLVSQLLQKGVKLRFNEQPFEIEGQNFDRGAVIVLKTSNQYFPNLWSEVETAANNAKVALTPISTGFVNKGADFGSSKVHNLKKRRVALLTGEGVGSNSAGEVWHFFDQQINYPVTLINVADFGRINWSNYDVVIMPDGNYRFLADKAQAEMFKNWINGGGNVIALEGAVAQLAKQDWAIKAKKTPEQTDGKDTYELLKKFEDRERDYLPNLTPGSIFKVELDNTHPLGFGFPKYYYTLKQDDAIYDFLKEGGWNVGVLKKNKQIAGVVGSKLISKLQDGVLFGTQEIGRGNVTYLADNVLFRSFWEAGKLMFSNAVFLVGQ